MPDNHFQSGLSQPELLSLLELLRRLPEIVILPDNEALPALDLLIAKYESAKQAGPSDAEAEWRQRDFESQRKRLKDELDRQREHIKRVRAGIAAPGPQLLWEARGLLTTTERLGEYHDAEVRDYFQSEIKSIQSEAKEVAEEAEVAAHEQAIRAALTQVIYNSSTVKSMVETIDRSLDALQKLGRLQQQTTLQAREGKERAARYRSQKKLDEADVAEAGGNSHKAQKLRREAAVLLSKDWAQVFPDEPSP